VHAPASIVAELDAHPVVDDPSFRMELSFTERSDRFRAILHEHLNRRAGVDDCVLITVSTQLEAHALTRWVSELPSAQTPWVVVLFLSDRWNRSGRADERQIAEFRKLRAAISGLSPMDAHRLIFFTVTAGLAAELTGLLDTPTVIDRPMTRPEYYSAVASADVGLFPYEVIPYRQRTSAVFAEMVGVRVCCRDFMRVGG
jgi:hypothetical protein